MGGSTQERLNSTLLLGGSLCITCIMNHMHVSVSVTGPSTHTARHPSMLSEPTLVWHSLFSLLRRQRLPGVGRPGQAQQREPILRAVC